MKVLRIMLETGMVVDIDQVPENYNLLLDVQTVRANGFYFNGMLYIPAERIVCMTYGEQGRMPIVFEPQGGTLQ